MNTADGRVALGQRQRAHFIIVGVMVASVSAIDAQQSLPEQVPNPPDTATSGIAAGAGKAAQDPTTLSLFANPSKAKPVLFDHSAPATPTPRWRWRASGREWRSPLGDARDTWRVNGGMSLETAGGLRFTAGVHGRRGVSLPLAFEQSLGDAVPLHEPFTTSSPPQWNTTVWDTQVRVEKVLKRTGPVRVRAVAEVLNLFEINPGSSGAAALGLAPRTVRAGLVIDFGR